MLAKAKTTPDHSVGRKKLATSAMTNVLNKVFAKKLNFFTLHRRYRVYSRRRFVGGFSKIHIQSGRRHDNLYRKMQKLSSLSPFFDGLNAKVFKSMIHCVWLAFQASQTCFFAVYKTTNLHESICMPNLILLVSVTGDLFFIEFSSNSSSRFLASLIRLA